MIDNWNNVMIKYSWSFTSTRQRYETILYNDGLQSKRVVLKVFLKMHDPTENRKDEPAIELTTGSACVVSD